LQVHGVPVERIENNRFYAPAEYRSRLERQGFQVEQITLTPRPTPLPSGMTEWLQTFRQSLFAQLPVAERPAAIEQVVTLLKPVLCDAEGKWTADYVRLRFVAHRP